MNSLYKLKKSILFVLSNNIFVINLITRTTATAFNVSLKHLENDFIFIHFPLTFRIVLIIKNTYAYKNCTMFKFLNTATLRIEELRVTTKSLRIKRNLGKMDKTPFSAISR